VENIISVIIEISSLVGPFHLALQIVHKCVPINS